MDYRPPKHPEETIEEKLDRINIALQNTMQEMDVSSQHIRNTSIMSVLHSYTTSYCNFDWIDAEPNSPNESKVDCEVVENIETLLVCLDRAQMQIEDFWAENLRNPKAVKSISEDTEKYIQKLERENIKLREGENRERSVSRFEGRKNLKLEQERKNFEEKLAELDFLTGTYKTKHSQIAVLEENLRLKEGLLDVKEKQLRQTKMELDKSKAMWEKCVIMEGVASTGKGKFALQEVVVEEAPPPALIPNRGSQILTLQQTLKISEMRLKASSDSEEKSRLLTSIDQVKNKIATLRVEQAMLDSGKSSRIMKDMARTMEKEVNYEENLRKMNLEKFSIRGPGRTTPKASANPNYSSTSSKRFLFRED